MCSEFFWKIANFKKKKKTRTLTSVKDFKNSLALLNKNNTVRVNTDI